MYTENCPCGGAVSREAARPGQVAKVVGHTNADHTPDNGCDYNTVEETQAR